MMVLLNQKVNNSPNGSYALTIIFLLTSRPLFVTGFALFILPIVLGNEVVRPVARFMAHEYWSYESRLVFGVFLCNSILMQYFTYDL